MSLLIFDSGIGGLGVAAALRTLNPGLPLTYLADNAGFPYGEQPDAHLLHRITTLIGAAIGHLRPAAIVIACNTASTIALAAVRAAYPATPFIGCVPPIKPAAAASLTGEIGLLATPATIRRPYLQALIADFAAGRTVHSLGTPALAPLAEAKFRGHPPSPAALAAAIAPLFAAGPHIDAIALGCTHYTFLLPELRALHPRIAFFDPAPAVARQALAVARDLPADSPGPATAWFTAALPDAAAMARRLAAHGFASLATFPHPAFAAPV